MAPVTDIEQRLREAMDGVTPGPWFYGIAYEAERGPVPFDYESPGFYENAGIIGADGTTVVGCDEYHVFNGEAEARYIALCSPDNIGALLDTIASLRSKLEEAEGALGPFADLINDEYDDVPNVVSVALVFDNGEEIGALPFGDLRRARRTLASLREADHA